MAKKKATSSQVAEKAGVSQATVSMILNRRSNVSFSAETVEKVECAARELGYELPHRKNKSNTRKEKLIVVLCAFVITDGGPMKATYVLGMKLYKEGFSYFKMGYASAISWIIFIVIMLITLVLFATSKWWVFYGDES